MPPRGGNPALTDADLQATLDYLHRLTGVRSN
jgi:cytochrome c5